MKEQPLISVITAAYNGARHLPYLIESVLSQDYGHFEHIIIDDGSEDGGKSVKVLERYPHLRWWSQENIGQYSTQNEGLKESRGEIITIINQDDAYFSTNVFSMVADSFQSHPQWDFVFGKTRYMDENGLPLPIRRGLEHRFSRWMIRHVSCIPHISLFVRRELIIGNGIFFDADLRMGGDWDWNIKMMEVSRDYGFIPQPLGLFRVHPEQKTFIMGIKGFVPEIKLICCRNKISYPLTRFLRFYLDTISRIKTAFVLLLEIGPVAFVKRAWRYLRKKFGKTGRS